MIPAPTLLRNILMQKLDLDELKNLAFDLGFDLEGLEKGELVRSLLGKLDKRGRLDSLLYRLWQTRPDIELREVATALGLKQVQDTSDKTDFRTDSFAKDPYAILAQVRQYPSLGLANVRLHLPQLLSTLYDMTDTNSPNPRPPGLDHIVSALSERKVITAEQAAALIEIILTANRAANGSYIRWDEAEPLARLGIQFLEELRGLQRNLMQTQFRDFFGISSTTKRVAIVLPKFQSVVRSRRPGQVMIHQGILLPRRRMARVPLIDTAVKEDVVAASDLISAFSAVGLESPSIIWDDEVFKQNSELTRSYTTLIAIGLFSNKLTMWLNEKLHVGRCFKLETSTNRLPKKRRPGMYVGDYKEIRGGITSSKAKYYETEPGKTDYGLIAKIVLEEGHTVFVSGGIDATGTSKMGRYIRDQWSDIRTWDDKKTHLTISKLPFAAIISVPLDDQRGIDRIDVKVPYRS